MGKYGSSSGASHGGGKPKHHNAFLGFLGNLVDDVQDTATGFIPGLAHMGSSIVHDAGHAVGLAHGPYQTDDILGAIRHSYTDPGTFWGELGRGHFGAAGHAFTKHPLSPALDVLAVFTGGAGAAAKGGKLLGVVDDAKKFSRIESADLAKGFERELSENPVIAGRQALVDRVSNRFDEAPIIGARSRVARHVKRLDARATARENAANLRPLREALAKVRGLKRKAVWIVAGGHDIDDLVEFYTTRHHALEQEIQRKASGGIRKGDATLVVKGGKAKRADLDEEMAYEERGFDSLRDADRAESIKVNQRNLARVKSRLGELEQIREKVDLNDPHIVEAAQAARDLSALTTKRLIDEGLDPELAVRRASLESELLKVAGVRGDNYAGAIRSHIAVRPEKLDVSSGRGRSKWNPGGKLDEAQRNSGYNFWNAKDSTNPAMFMHSARQVFEYRARLDRFESMLGYAHMVSPKEAAELAASGEWKVIGDALKPEIDGVYRILEQGRSVLEGTPGYESFLRALEESFVAPSTFAGKTDLVPVVPVKFYSEVAGEFQRASNFVRKWIDAPTRVWRSLTLNLRPAWIVNNFVGQMLLLAVAHGARGVKAYVEQFGRKGKVVDELVPELTDFSWAHESLADLAGMGGNVVTRGMRRVSDFLGNLNAKLTDDHTRKAAWIAEMKPHVASYRKAHPGTSWGDAARALWNNEQFADTVTERVLADMIDFSDLSNFERSVVKRAIPFYAWMKGISRRTARLVADEPVKAAIGANIGQQGLNAVEERYGDLPRFLQGMVGLKGDTALVTQGLNPFMTPADLTGMMSGAVLPGRQQGAQNPLAQFNPLLKAPLEALANRDFFYGGEVDPKGEMSFVQRLAKQGGNSFAQKRLLDEWLQQRKAQREGLDYDPLFEPSFRNALASYFGVPLRTLDVNAARARAARGA